MYSAILLVSHIGPWSEHGTAWYNCNRFDESSSSNARETQSKSRASLERYLHVSVLFVSFFLNDLHNRSITIDLPIMNNLQSWKKSYTCEQKKKWRNFKNPVIFLGLKYNS